MKEDSLAETIAFGPPRGKNYERRTRYIGEFCLEQGKVYKLRMKDRNNDGLVSCTFCFWVSLSIFVYTSRNTLFVVLTTFLFSVALGEKDHTPLLSMERKLSHRMIQTLWSRIINLL